MKKGHGLLAGAVCLMVLGCGEEKEDGGAESTVAVAEGTIEPEAGDAPIDTVTPYAGLWDAGVIQGHLARQGIMTSEAGTIRNPLLGPRGTRLKGEAGEVQVFVYADASARARDADSLKLVELRAMPGFEHASLVAADNIAMLVVGPDSTLRHSVQQVVLRRR